VFLRNSAIRHSAPLSPLYKTVIPKRAKKVQKTRKVIIFSKNTSSSSRRRGLNSSVNDDSREPAMAPLGWPVRTVRRNLDREYGENAAADMNESFIRGGRGGGRGGGGAGDSGAGEGTHTFAGGWANDSDGDGDEDAKMPWGR
jgi:hypothetical protein